MPPYTNPKGKQEYFWAVEGAIIQDGYLD